MTLPAFGAAILVPAQGSIVDTQLLSWFFRLLTAHEYLASRSLWMTPLEVAYWFTGWMDASVGQ